MNYQNKHSGIFSLCIKNNQQLWRLILTLKRKIILNSAPVDDLIIVNPPPGRNPMGRYKLVKVVQITGINLEY